MNIVMVQQCIKIQIIVGLFRVDAAVGFTVSWQFGSQRKLLLVEGLYLLDDFLVRLWESLGGFKTSRK